MPTYSVVNRYALKTLTSYIEGQNTQCYNERRVHGGRGQVVRRQVVALEIVGSSPIAHPSAPVAQRIEHWSSEPGVVGSNPSGRANEFKTPREYLA